MSSCGAGSVLLFGDAVGLPESLNALPEGRAVGLVAAQIRPGEHAALQKLAATHGIPFLIQPVRGSAAFAEFSRAVQQLAPDFILTNSYSMLLPPDILAAARVSAVNIHGGLLPEYRGSNPLQWALIHGESETGVTMHFMDEGFDTGDVIARRRVPIHLEDTWLDVFAQLRQATQAILADHLPAVLEGWSAREPQDESKARHHRRRHPDDGRIDWQARVIDIHNLIRALVPPMPGAFYEEGGRRIILDRYHSLAEVAALKLAHSHGPDFRISAQATGPAGNSGNVIGRVASSNGTVVAIHQPNFFPWLGFFDKIRKVDVFIVLDNVQLPKTGGTWANRVRLLVSGAPAWVTVPIVRGYHGTRTIADTDIDNHVPWRAKLLKTIELNYRRAPHFDAVFPWLSDLIDNSAGKIADYNMHAIRAVASALHMDTVKLVMGSSLAADGQATTLLISMVRAVHGDAYLAGGGAADYQDDAMFSDAGLELRYQDFQHPVYRQFNADEFVPGLSVVDALMNCGFEGTADLLTQGRSE